MHPCLSILKRKKIIKNYKDITSYKLNRNLIYNNKLIQQIEMLLIQQKMLNFVPLFLDCGEIFKNLLFFCFFLKKYKK